jgi:hypothetical protein
LFRTKIISGQENTQPLKVDTMAKDKGQMTNNDLLNTTGKKQTNKQSKRLINTNPTKAGCELM